VTFLEECLLEELEIVILPRWRRAENLVKSMERKRKLSWDGSSNTACKVKRSSGVRAHFWEGREDPQIFFIPARNKGGVASGTNMRKVGLECVADARKIGGDRSGFDMMRHKNDVKAKIVRCGVDREIMKFAKRELGL
jgi:hypothetical protein